MKLDYGSGYNPRKGYKTSDVTGSPYLNFHINPYTYKVNCFDNHFNEVLVRNVFHHIPDPAKLFKELKRILTHGGKAVIVEPNESAYSANVFLDKLWYRWILPRRDIWICENYRSILKYAEKYFDVEAVKEYNEKITYVLRSKQ